MTCHQECCSGCPSFAARPFGSTVRALSNQRPNRLVRLFGGSIDSATATTPEWVGCLRPTRPTHFAAAGTYPGPTITFRARGITAKTAGLVPYDLSVDGELQAPRACLNPDLLR